MMPKCPSCNGSDVGKLDGQCAVCRQCSKTKQSVYLFCWACQREWPRGVSSDKACTLPNCAIRAALLSSKRIKDPNSSANGCPYFRACPDCKALLTHNGVGCPNIVCPRCGNEFCFRCLNRWCFRFSYPPDFEMWMNRRRRNACSIVKNRDSLRALGL